MRAGHGQPGVRTWHEFSAGAHYDPDDVGHGPVIGCDVHLVEPGAGFDWHPHRGVHILSWVLSGALRHEGSDGTVRVVRPGTVLVQPTGRGIRHRETNASATDPLRLLQLTLLDDATALAPLSGRTAPVPAAATWEGRPPVEVPGCRIELRHSRPADGAGLAVALPEGNYLAAVFASTSVAPPSGAAVPTLASTWRIVDSNSARD